MHRTFRTSRRFLLPALVALALVAQGSGATLAGNLETAERTTHPVAAATAGNDWLTAVARLGPDIPLVRRPLEPMVDWAGRGTPSVATSLAARQAAAKAAPRASAAVVSTVAAAPVSGVATYRGTNRVWIPSLGINRAVEFFPCSRSKPPGHQVYRWGCAGSNNVYLFAHAATVFKPLHDAYVSGRLRKGMQVVYADGNGRVSRYAVSFWKVTRPDGDIGWAYAAQSRPSMTLQTCVGANSAYRLVVRLVKVG